MTIRDQQVRLGTFERFALATVQALLIAGVAGAVVVYREVGQLQEQVRGLAVVFSQFDSRIAALERGR